MKIILDLPAELTVSDVPDMKQAIIEWAQLRAQSRRGRNNRDVKYPNLRRAAAVMGYNFSYLWRVLEDKPGYKGRPGLIEDFWAMSAQITAEREADKSA